MRRRTISALATAITVGAAAAQPIPSTWAEFTQAATTPADKALVAAVQKLDPWKACAEWGQLYRTNKNAKRETAIRLYLESEQLVTRVDAGHLGDRSIAIGM